MLFQAIASGSNGNCGVLNTDDGTILIDAGISRKRVISGLKDLKIKPSSVKYILITHAHGDHINGLPVLYDFLPKAKVVATVDTIREIRKLQRKDRRFNRVSKTAIPIHPFERVEFGGYGITTYPTLHDIAGSSGFEILHYKSENIFTYATDTAGIGHKFQLAMRRSEVIFLESNFEPELLNRSKRPVWLKRRIINTHLSNEKYIKIIKRVLSKTTKCVISGHISGECNRPEIVAEMKRNSLNSKSVEWIVCSRFEKSPKLKITDDQTLIEGGLTSRSKVDKLEHTLDEFFP